MFSPSTSLRPGIRINRILAKRALSRGNLNGKARLCPHVIDSFGCKCQRQIQYDIGLPGCPSGRWLKLNGSGMNCFRLRTMTGAQCRTQYRSPQVLWTQARFSEVHLCRYYGRNMLIFSAPGETGHTRIPNTHWGINPARDAPTSPVLSR